MYPKLAGKIILAPLAGVNDPAFRLLCREQGASASYSEMISSEALVNDSETTKFLLEHSEDERPFAIQLFGNNPENVAKAAKIIEKTADIIDINMACPVEKITSNGDGCALMSDLDKAEQIISAVTKAIKKPLTIKIRLGMTKNTISCLRLGKIAEKAGASAIALHARTADQGYSGKPALNFIKQLKESVSIPVIGNGDVTDGPSAKNMFKTGCDYIMIGRAAMGNPLIFKEINHYLSTGEKLMHTPQEKIAMFFKYLEYTKRFKHIHFQYIKQQASYFTVGVKGGKHARVSLMKTNKIEEVKKIMMNLSTGSQTSDH